MVGDQADSTPEDGGHSHELFDTNTRRRKIATYDWLLGRIKQIRRRHADLKLQDCPVGPGLCLVGGSRSLSGRWVPVSVWSVGPGLCRLADLSPVSCMRPLAEQQKLTLALASLWTRQQPAFVRKGSRTEKRTVAGMFEQRAVGWSADLSTGTGCTGSTVRVCAGPSPYRSVCLYWSCICTGPAWYRSCVSSLLVFCLLTNMDVVILKSGGWR